MNRILVFAAVLTSYTPCAAQEISVEKFLAQSDPEIQTQIGKVLDVLDPRASQHSIQALQEIEALKGSIADKGEIVKQIAIFGAAPDADERQRLMAPLVLHLLDLPSNTVIRALAPYLSAENENFRSFVRGWFRGHDKGGSGTSRLHPVNYKEYADYANRKTRRNEEVPTAFVEYIYERSPDRALLVFLRADRQRDLIARMMEMNKQSEAARREREKNGDRKAELLEMNKMFEAFHRGLRKNGKETLPIDPLPPPVVEKIVVGKIPDDIPPLRDEMQRQRDEKLYKEIRLTEHIVSNVIWLKKNKYDERFQKALPEAKEELAKLAEYDQWWARFYVAQIMRRHRELRLADVLARLSRDSNALVSKLAKSLTETK